MVHDVGRYCRHELPDLRVIPEASRHRRGQAIIQSRRNTDEVITDAGLLERGGAVAMIARDDMQLMAARGQPAGGVANPPLDGAALRWRDRQQFRRHMTDLHAAARAATAPSSSSTH